eukprot:2461472-Karenia_brevis.AAC.1
MDENSELRTINANLESLQVGWQAQSQAMIERLMTLKRSEVKAEIATIKSERAEKDLEMATHRLQLLEMKLN